MVDASHQGLANKKKASRLGWPKIGGFVVLPSSYLRNLQAGQTIACVSTQVRHGYEFSMNITNRVPEPCHQERAEARPVHNAQRVSEIQAGIVMPL